MGSTVFLLRNGNTVLCEQGRLLGRRDIALSSEGKRQAAIAKEALAQLEITELVASPLASATETAEIVLPESSSLTLCRDPRLNNVDLGRWEGASLEELSRSSEFCRLLAGDEQAFVDGEGLEEVRRRVVSSVEQALDDNPSDANIVMVSHSVPIRIAMAHYLEMPLAAYHRLRLSPGALCVLRRERDLDTTRVLATNWPSPLESLLAPVRGVS